MTTLTRVSRSTRVSFLYEALLTRRVRSRCQGRRVVLYDAIGPGEHACHWCGQTVTWDIVTAADPRSLFVDHVDFNKLNNDRANLVPSCWDCNIARTRARSGVC